MKRGQKKRDYKKMCEVLYKSTQHALRSLESDDIYGAEIALLMGQSTCEMLYFESTSKSYNPNDYEFDKLMEEDEELF